MQLTLEDVRPLVGSELVDADGDKVGNIEDIYLDNETQQPEWALVHTGLLGRKLSYVPLIGASPAGGKLRANFKESQIKGAPGIEPDKELT
ncbi:MAG TPA: PRC-barrel domain-containing protein, partial [Acidimicrobiales bacterium]|nr:PRC-barrel domain-containing protein [Acidimicrobiales bacterium]